MSDVLARVKRLKENAKASRDFEDLDEALNDLSDAIKLLEGAYYNSEDADYKISLQRELADCYGMMGGLYRRLAYRNRRDFELNLQRASNMYSKGLKFEDGITDSYNLSNSVVTPILLDPLNLERQRINIEKGIAKIQEQVKGKRKDQWWAWADLGLFKVLDGDIDGALEAYRQFKRAGARTQDYKSTISVLNNLWERLQRAESSTTKSVAQSAERALKFLMSNQPR